MPCPLYMYSVTVKLFTAKFFKHSPCPVRMVRAHKDAVEPAPLTPLVHPTELLLLRLLWSKQQSSYILAFQQCDQLVQGDSRMLNF